MTLDDFRVWHKAIGLSQVVAAKGLGASKPTIVMRQGSISTIRIWPEIPKTMALACAALYCRVDVMALPVWDIGRCR